MSEHTEKKIWICLKSVGNRQLCTIQSVRSLMSPSAKGGGSACGGEWEPAKPADERFRGELGQIITSHTTGKRGGYVIDTKIGDNRKAIKEWRYTDHGRPDLHTDPHDRMIDWSTGIPQLGPPINYPNGAPEFKIFGEYSCMRKMIGINSFEDNCFKSISDFKWCVNCGGEIEFEWKGRSYGVWPKQRRALDAPLQMLISQIHVDVPASTQKWCDTADELLEYIVIGE